MTVSENIVCKDCNSDDIEYNIVYEELDSTYTEVKNFTFSYDLRTDSWLTSLDYIMNGCFIKRNRKFYSFDSLGNLVRHDNKKEPCKFYDGITYPSYITPVFVTPFKYKEKQLPQQVVSLNWQTSVYSLESGLENIEILDDTFDKIALLTSYQNTGIIDIVTFDRGAGINSNYDIANTRRIKSFWGFNKIRDKSVKLDGLQILPNYNETHSDFIVFEDNIDNSKEFIFRRRIIDDYILVYLEISNSTPENIEIHDVNIISKPVSR